MKRLFLLAFLPIFLFSCDKETVVEPSKVPAEVKNYINTHFPANEIIQIIEDKDGLELTYDVTLKDGILLEFNRKKEIIDIESRTKLPDSVIPAKILDYTKANYASNFIIGWELDDRNQQIRLDNGMDLEFTMSGDFLRIDN